MSIEAALAAINADGWRASLRQTAPHLPLTYIAHVRRQVPDSAAYTGTGGNAAHPDPVEALRLAVISGLENEEYHRNYAPRKIDLSTLLPPPKISPNRRM